MALIEPGQDTTIYRGSDFTTAPGAPCLECISNNEKLSLILWALANYMDITVADVLEESKCLRCMSDSQILTALTMVTLDEFAADSSVADILEEIKCLRCAGSRKQLLAGILYELANITNFTP